MRALRISKDIELLIGASGAMQSLFITLYIFLGKKRNVSNVLLACFFILITVRITKSVLWIYLDEVPNWFLNIGYISHFALGPTLFLYFTTFIYGKRWIKIQYLHFIPAIALCLFLFRINGLNFWYKGGYSFLLFHQLIYTILSLVVLLKGYKKRSVLIYTIKKRQWNWLFLLIIGITTIQVAYFSNYILELTPYSAGPVIYAFFIYAIALFAVLDREVLDNGPKTVKYKNININDESFDYYKKQILNVMIQEKPYLNSSFTLDELSKLVSLPPYLTSHVINKGFNKNFSDFINYYRIDIAKSKLTSSRYDHIKISEIAYDSGFNSLTAFNLSFKNIVNCTPSQFRKKASKSY